MRIPVLVLWLALLLPACSSVPAESAAPPAEPGPAEEVVVQLYDVRDLIGLETYPRLADGDRLDALAANVEAGVSPAVRESGSLTIEALLPGTLVIRAPERTHRRIAGILHDYRSERIGGR